MMDSKYGRIFTEDDVKMIVAAAVKADDPSTVDLHPLISNLGGYGFETRFPEDEPIFVIRGKDKAALRTIIYYYDAAITEGAGDEHLENVTKAITEFRMFAEENPQRIKIPD